MYVRNWEDFVRVDERGFIVQHSPSYDASGINWSDISNRLDDISATATPVPGNLDGIEEGDLIAFNLTAGQTYSFDYRGAPGGVVDPYLVLLNSSGGIIQQDDDGGLGRGALITFTPTATGTYYLYATSYYTVAGENPSVDAGDYTINAWTREADVPGTTNVLASLPTAVSISLGTYFGNIDTSGDNDYFQIQVEQGQFYSFVLAGGAAANAEFSTPGNTAATVSLYRPDGSLIASNLNFESSVGYFAQQSGTIYVRVAGLAGTTGGYTLDANQIDLSTRDPIESLNWDSADNIDTVDVDGVPTAYVYFGAAGENFGEAVVNQGWQPHQIAAVMNALAEYTPITGIHYEITTDVDQAEFRMITVATATYGARFYPQDPAYGTQQGIGTFNLASGGFGAFPQSLDRGGFSYAVILHEFGHAHGIAHPHDTGGGSEVMLGVSGATGSLGVYNLNQGVYTVMSYNDAWQLHPNGASPLTVMAIDNGWSATLGAFDIAVLQARYGVHAYNEGDNVYTLTDIADDAFYQTIWDSGGNDTIAYGGTFNAQIDLTAATLDYTPTGGGVVSFLYNPLPLGQTSTLVRGGYTIANGVVIENATGGSGDDIMLGNAAANILTGNSGADVLMGRDGDDQLLGGDGHDRLEGGLGSDLLNGGGGDDLLDGGAGRDIILAGDGVDRILSGDGLDVITLGAGDDVFVAELGATKAATKSGTFSVDIITDFDSSGNDIIDLSSIGSTFIFDGTAANKDAGDLTYKTYDSITGAERALGFDIDGNPGAGGVAGPVTIVYGNIDGGSPDFAIVLLNTRSVDATDFIFGAPTEPAASASGTFDYVSTGIDDPWQTNFNNALSVHALV